MKAVALCRKYFFPSHDPTREVHSETSQTRISMWERLENALAAHSAKSTVRDYMRALEEFCTVVKIPFDTLKGEELIRAITPADADFYITWCRKQPAQKGRSSMVADTVSLGTVRKKAMILHSVFEHLLCLEYIRQNPFISVKNKLQHHKGGDRRDTKLVPFSKLKELLSIKPMVLADYRDLALLALLFGGGLRRSEAVAIRIMDIKEAPKGGLFLTLRNTKRQCVETQVVLPFAISHIRRYIEIRRKEGATAREALFIAYRGRRASQEPLSDSAVYLIFRAWMKRIGLDETYTPHSARATAITLLLERGKHHRTVMKFSRHQSIEMVVHYDKLRHKDCMDDFDDVEL